MLFLTFETSRSVDAKVDNFFLCRCLKTIFPTNLGRKSVELTTETKELIVAPPESVKNKDERSRLLKILRTTIKSVPRSYKRTGSVENSKRSGRKKKFTNRGGNALLRLAKANRQPKLQDITSKLNECKAQIFCKKSVQRVRHSQGYKRGSAKRKWWFGK